MDSVEPQGRPIVLGVLRYMVEAVEAGAQAIHRRHPLEVLEGPVSTAAAAAEVEVDKPILVKTMMEERVAIQGPTPRVAAARVVRLAVMETQEMPGLHTKKAAAALEAAAGAAIKGAWEEPVVCLVAAAVEVEHLPAQVLSRGLVGAEKSRCGHGEEFRCVGL